MRRLSLVLAVSCLSLPAFAQGEAEKPDPELESAKTVLKQYLDFLVKSSEGKKPKPADVAKKLQGAKKFLHAKTLEFIAGQEQKKLVTNALAVWVHAKEDFWLREYEIGELRKGVLGTVAIEARERNWRVAEGGEDGEHEPTSYLLGKVNGKWLLVDKRRNETFSDAAIKAGYRDYFEAEKKEPKKEEPKAE